MSSYRNHDDLQMIYQKFKIQGVEFFLRCSVPKWKKNFPCSTLKIIEIIEEIAVFATRFSFWYWKSREMVKTRSNLAQEKSARCTLGGNTQEQGGRCHWAQIAQMICFQRVFCCYGQICHKMEVKPKWLYDDLDDMSGPLLVKMADLMILNLWTDEGIPQGPRGPKNIL